ncbi:MAG: hypothetical protein COX19_10805 [Desulfobacterales bacterium CG23_combo_of_CG06-09_8_20_14_all_51_8]|nr:MAG: hypothetical protein COX19_10805 [Desulfobacterales bacterium CG23_combo_of_CG06-09_8_20_14_all_51_8]
MKLIKAQRSFHDFVYEILSVSFDKFIGGAYIDEVCDLYNSCQHTARISPRDHFKSTGLYAMIMYDLLFWKGDLENHYFSYQETMAGYHIGKIKNLIARNPFYEHLIDLSKGESKIRYKKKDGSIFRVDPHGLLAFKRGIHAPRIYVDDPFQDPENKLLPTTIKKINDVFVTQIMDMVTQDGRLHVAGTPQTNFDFFFDQKVMQEFAVMIKPAVLSYKEKTALWPEHMDFEELMKRKEIRGIKIFNQEYMCSPVWSEDSFFKEPQLLEVVNSKLHNLPIYDKIKTFNNVVAGFDIGKKSHPSHLAVFELHGNLAVQLHSKFMDGWNYAGDGTFNPQKPTQVEYLLMAIENFKIDQLFYDDTRAEFESLRERGILPAQCVPVTFTTKEKHSMAVEFDKSVTQKKIELLDDQRQTEQILMVTNDLKALETPMGHGDSFWSIALAHKGINPEFGRLSDLYPDQMEETKEKPVTAGLQQKVF